MYRLPVRERLNRKAYLLTEKKKSKFRKFKAYPPGYLHIDMKYSPEARQTTPLPFCGHQAAHTRLATIGVYPGSGVMDAAGSYDRDMRFGGSIRQYEYSWLGRSLTHDKPRQTVVFPGIGIFPVGLRVRDTDRSWSKLFQTSVEIR